MVVVLCQCKPSEFRPSIDEFQALLRPGRMVGPIDNDTPVGIIIRRNKYTGYYVLLHVILLLMLLLMSWSVVSTPLNKNRGSSTRMMLNSEQQLKLPTGV